MFTKECKIHLKKDKMGPAYHFLVCWCLNWTLLKMIVGLGIHSILPRFFQTYYGDNLDKLSRQRKEFIKNSNWGYPTIDME